MISKDNMEGSLREKNGSPEKRASRQNSYFAWDVNLLRKTEKQHIASMMYYHTQV